MKNNKSWTCSLVSVFLLQFAGFALAVCQADELPTVAELRQYSAKLRADSSEVQGEIRVYRSETVIPEALEKLPDKIGIPLTLSGKLWRSKERFRADIKIFHGHKATGNPNNLPSETQHSEAIDGGIVYQMQVGNETQVGDLQIYSADTTEASTYMRAIKSRYLAPLDSLWSSGGIPFVDYLQRPGTKIVPSKRYPGGYSMLASGEGTKLRLEFEASDHHPLGYCLASDGAGDRLVKMERRVFSSTQEGLLLPTRIVDVVALGLKNGYTEVVMFDLKPLQAASPIAKRLTSESFRDLGFGYQVYSFRSSGKQEIDERYGMPITSLPASATKTGKSLFRAYFLWGNAFVMLALVAFIAYRHIRKKRR